MAGTGDQGQVTSSQDSQAPPLEQGGPGYILPCHPKHSSKHLSGKVLIKIQHDGHIS